MDKSEASAVKPEEKASASAAAKMNECVKHWEEKAKVINGYNVPASKLDQVMVNGKATFDLRTQDEATGHMSYQLAYKPAGSTEAAKYVTDDPIGQADIWRITKDGKRMEPVKDKAEYGEVSKAFNNLNGALDHLPACEIK